MNKYITMLIGALVTMLSFSSCTDQDDIEITTEKSFSITAKHLFSSFTPYKSTDFDLKYNSAQLIIDVLIYNESGELVDKEQFETDNIDETFRYAPMFTPGKYKVIAIAHFNLLSDGNNFSYWGIKNQDALTDLTIEADYQNEEYMFTSAFETLGIYNDDFEITHTPSSLDIDIKPATALVQVFSTNASYTGIAYYDKYSTKCLNAIYSILTAPTVKDCVKFDSSDVIYQTSEQIKNYKIYYTIPFDQLIDKTSPITYCYRALLPEDSKVFNWEIEKGESTDPSLKEAVDVLVGSYPDKGSTEKINLESGKMYLLATILDAPKVIANELANESFDFDKYVQSFMDSFNKERIANMINYGWEQCMRTPSNFVNRMVGVEPYEIEYRPTIDRYCSYFYAGPYSQFYVAASAAYLDKEMKDCVGITLNLSYPAPWGKTISESDIDYLLKLLGEKYTFNKQVGEMYGYFVGTRETAKTIVVLDLSIKDSIVLTFRDREYNW